MKNAYEVLQEKEADFTRVRKEVESLKITAALLAEDHDLSLSSEDSSSLHDAISRLSESALTNVSSVESSRSGLWNSLKRAR